MTLLEPFWLLAALPLALLLWSQRSDRPDRQRRRLLWMRGSLLALVVLALAAPVVTWRSSDLDVAVLVDVSASVEPASLNRALQAIDRGIDPEGPVRLFAYADRAAAAGNAEDLRRLEVADSSTAAAGNATLDRGSTRPRSGEGRPPAACCRGRAWRCRPRRCWNRRLPVAAGPPRCPATPRSTAAARGRRPPFARPRPRSGAIASAASAPFGRPERGRHRGPNRGPVSGAPHRHGGSRPGGATRVDRVGRNRQRRAPAARRRAPQLGLPARQPRIPARGPTDPARRRRRRTAQRAALTRGHADRARVDVRRAGTPDVRSRPRQRRRRGANPGRRLARQSSAWSPSTALCCWRQPITPAICSGCWKLRDCR